MRRQVLIYGLLGGALIALLKVVEYRYLVIERSYEIYGGAIAVLFAALGIWLGVRMTGRKERIVLHEVPAPREFVRDEEKLSSIGMTKRELEMLELLALGLSNFVERYASTALEKVRASGATEAQLAAKEAEMARFSELYRNPLFNVGITFLEVFPVGLVIALISAGVLSRRSTSRLSQPAAG